MAAKRPPALGQSAWRKRHPGSIWEVFPQALKPQVLITGPLHSQAKH
jgi:hypothetical protein